MSDKSFYAVLEYTPGANTGSSLAVAAVRLKDARACLKWIKANGQDGATYVGVKVVTNAQQVHHKQITKAVVTEGRGIDAEVLDE